MKIISRIPRTLLISLAITALFSIQFAEVLPFSGFLKTFNQETVASYYSYLLFAQEPWAFPVGEIRGLSFPFEDGNIGNTGVIPLFALFFKALGTLFPYFKSFYYFVLIDIVACFLTSFFSLNILVRLGVRNFSLLLLGALLTGTSLMLFSRSSWMQPFCVVAFPIYTAWIYVMLIILEGQKDRVRLGLISLFIICPIASLLDNYALFAILLGTSIILVRELYEFVFGGLQSSRRRFFALTAFCLLGVMFSLIALYLIGMYPLPSIPHSFSSYDFGMGGRIHVADLLAPVLPSDNGTATYFREPSLPGKLGFPYSTKMLQDGQVEGFSYIGTSALVLWIFLCFIFFYSASNKNRVTNFLFSSFSRLRLYSSWGKIFLACLGVFVFSLGFELHILGESFPNFYGMPAAWISDRFHFVHNIRAQGRLATLLSIFLILDCVRRFSWWCEERELKNSGAHFRRVSLLRISLVTCLIGIHFVEIIPLLKPVQSQNIFPLGGWSTDEISSIKRMAIQHDAVLISPSWREGLEWQTRIYSLAYHLGLRSNIYLIARTQPERDARIARDLNLIIRGDWLSLNKEYGDSLLIAIPVEVSHTLRARETDHYFEVIVGPISLWTRRR